MKINEHILSVKGLKHTYRFLQITDLHILLLDDDFSKEKKEVYTRRKGILFTRNGTSSEYKFSNMMTYAHEHHLFPILTGDILDFPSKTNIDFLDQELAKVDDYFFVVGNHDWTYMDQYQGLINDDDYRSKETFDKYYHLFDKYVKDGTLEAEKREFEDLLIFGLDTHDSHISKEQVDYFESLIQLHKPILIAAHAPFFEADMQKTYDAFAPGYLKKVAFGQKQLPLGENERRFKELLINPNSNVVAYLCGHAHCTISTKIGGIVPEFQLGGSYEDEVNLIVLTPGE